MKGMEIMEHRKIVMPAVVMFFLFSISAYGMYCPQTGRFLQRDPIGVDPAPNKPNTFSPTKQYKDGMSLYEYVKSQSLTLTDPSGYTNDLQWPLWRPEPNPNWPGLIPPDGPDYGGGQLNLGLIAIGIVEVNCTDECNKEHTFVYEKWCLGVGFGVSFQRGHILRNMNREKCREGNYEGWFFEVGASFGTPIPGLGVGGGGDISFGEGGIGDVIEIGVGGSYGIGPAVEVYACEYRVHDPKAPTDDIYYPPYIRSINVGGRTIPIPGF